MKFQLERTSDYHQKDIIEINTLEDLMNLVEKEGHVIIFQKPETIDEPATIEIYDTYRE